MAPQAGHSPFTPRVPSQIMETSKAFAEIVGSVSPAVVNISTTKVMRRDLPFSEDPFFDFFRPFRDFGSPKKWKEQSLGSGVIVTSDGYIITNNHVVEKSEEIRVTLYDKRSFRGKVVGADPKTDIAVLKISADRLPMVPWGDSDKLQVGEFVLAVGNPFGLSHTVTMGIISAVGRANVGIADYEDFIQTDAAINPGNSGGPLVNTKGELIVINTAIFSRSGGYQGIGFAVPSNMSRLVMDQIMDTASISSMIAVAAAREALNLQIREEGTAGRPDLPRLTMYTSEQSHSSIEKGGIVLGIGRQNIRKSEVDADFRMKPACLAAAIEADRRSGSVPFFACATVGTTSTTSIDPVPAIADICGRERVWLHVDGAYGGNAAVVPEKRWVLQGVERADSFVMNPHKWMFTPIDFSAFYTRHVDTLKRAFSILPEYLRNMREKMPGPT